MNTISQLCMYEHRARSNPTYPLSCGACLRRLRHVVPDATVSDYVALPWKSPTNQGTTVFHALIVTLLFMSCDISAKNREVGRGRGGLQPPGKHNFYRLNFITLFYNHGPTLRQPPLPMHCQRWSKSSVVIMKIFPKPLVPKIKYNMHTVMT